MSINAEIILKVVASLEGAKIIIKTLARGIVSEALILKVADKISSEQLKIKRIAGKVVDLKNKLVSQKLKLKALQSKKREVTPAIIFITDSNALIIKKKKLGLSKTP